MITIQTEPKRPKWSDRQLIAASDLASEQAWSDAQLNRLRSYAHGWGVVAGLGVSRSGDTVDVLPGYGITPTGHEVYVPQLLVLQNASAALIQTCATVWGGSCDVLPTEDGDEGGDTRTAWLVIRPGVVDTCPRAGVPEGCGHPGNQRNMSRQGAIMTLELICDLPQEYQAGDADCETYQALLKGGTMPMPAPLTNILPIAELTYTRGGLQDLTIETRRRLLPVSVLQGALACCECSHEEPEEPDEDDGEVRGPWDNPFDGRLDELIAEFEGFLPESELALDLTLDEIFTTRSGSPFGRARDATRDALLLQSLAAAALVQNAASHADFARGNYAKIYKDFQRANAGGGGSAPVGPVDTGPVIVIPDDPRGPVGGGPIVGPDDGPVVGPIPGVGGPLVNPPFDPAGPIAGPIVINPPMGGPVVGGPVIGRGGGRVDLPITGFTLIDLDIVVKAMNLRSLLAQKPSNFQQASNRLSNPLVASFMKKPATSYLSNIAQLNFGPACAAFWMRERLDFFKK